MTELVDEEEPLQRFIREARAAADLNHPNIVKIYDPREEGGRAFGGREPFTGDSPAAVAYQGRGATRLRWPGSRATSPTRCPTSSRGRWKDAETRFEDAGALVKALTYAVPRDTRRVAGPPSRGRRAGFRAPGSR